MKKLIFPFLILSITMNLSAQKTIVLPDLQKPHQIAVDGNDLYLFDEADYSLHVYTISPFALKLKLGQKGDGPHDFKYLPFVYVRPETIACTDFTKTLWFSREGKFLKVKPYTEIKHFSLDAEMLLIPIKDRLVQITADHAQQKRRVYLLNSEYETIKELYKGPFTWRSDAPIHYRTDTICFKDTIFISDTLKGFHIMVFDDKRNYLLTIDKSQDMEKIPNHPLLHQYCVSDDKIYATTYKKKDNKTEMIILDLNGRILRRLYLPLTSIRPQRGVLRYDLYTVSQDKLYELIQNRETGNWELLITALEPIPSSIRSSGGTGWGSQQPPAPLEQTFHVYLPEGYQASAEAFPVLYLLYNGYDRFLSQTATLQRLYDRQAVPPMIVIALEVDGRRDLTPTQAPAYSPTSGGAPDFIKVLKEKTVPYVEKAFRTKPPRIFWSHSIGGTFGLYALLSAPEIFNACLVSSPYFLYDGEARFLLQSASSFLKKRTAEKNYLYITVGDEPALIKEIEAFLDILKTENPPGLKWDFLPMPGETHESIQFRSLEAGLRALVSALSGSLLPSAKEFKTAF